MAGVLLDTSVYINAFRSGDFSIFSARSIPVNDDGERVPVWLSAVVLEELLAGATLQKAKKAITELEDDFEGVNRLLVPLKSDWTNTGKVLNKIGRKHGFEQIGKARITNDTLIAVSAARNGMTVLTSDPKDFGRIAEFTNFSWKLM